jgi:hypothetical protein
MKKIIINTCYGGFGLSDKAKARLEELGHAPFIPDIPYDEWRNYDWDLNPRGYVSEYDVPRDLPLLIQVIEELGEESFGDYAKLKIIEIHDDIEWQIEGYDGLEWVAEKHRTWS